VDGARWTVEVGVEAGPLAVAAAVAELGGR